MTLPSAQRAPVTPDGPLTGAILWFNGLVEGYNPQEYLRLVRENGARVEHHFRAR